MRRWVRRWVGGWREGGSKGGTEGGREGGRKDILHHNAHVAGVSVSHTWSNISE